MKLIVGLGNPDKKYQNTRHNLGFVIADRLQSTVYSQANWKTEKKLLSVVCRPKAVDLILAKPQVFMNNCGQVVKKVASYYKITTENILIIRDDIDMEIGKIRGPVTKTGSGGHKGIESIISFLATKNFWQLKIGIGRPAEEMLPEDYVLQNFNHQELELIKNSINLAVEKIENWITP